MSSEIERAIEATRAQLLAGDEAVLRRVTAEYLRVRERLLTRIAELERELAAADSVSRGFALERAQTLLAQTEAELTILGRRAEPFLTAAQREAVRLATNHAATLAGLQGTSSWTRLNTGAVTDLIGGLSDGSPLKAWANSFGFDASARLRAALIQGVAEGDHPVAVADRLRAQLNVAGFNFETTARSVMLDSYRSATLRTYAENADVLRGWQWVSALAGSCPACASLHGSEHPLSEQFFPGHLNCRCSAIALVKDVASPITESGEDWFASQPSSYQDGILGLSGGNEYRSGRVALTDYAKLERDDRWGDRYVPDSTSGALARAGVAEAAA